jgi:hypothetical protein
MNVFMSRGMWGGRDCCLMKLFEKYTLHSSQAIFRVLFHFVERRNAFHAQVRRPGLE